MKTNLVRAALVCAILASSSTSALARGGFIIPLIAFRVVDSSGATVTQAHTDASGAIRTSSLPPGEYEIDIDGPSLIAAMDKFAPPTPTRHTSEPSISLGVGDLFGGRGGSHHSDHQGAGPVGGGGSHSGGGGIGIGGSVAVGDLNGDGRPDDAVLSGGTAPMLTFTITVSPSVGSEGVANFSSTTPYCRDTAGQGVRMGFTVPKGSANARVDFIVRPFFL